MKRRPVWRPWAYEIIGSRTGEADIGSIWEHVKYCKGLECARDFCMRLLMVEAVERSGDVYVELCVVDRMGKKVSRFLPGFGSDDEPPLFVTPASVAGSRNSPE